MNNTQLKNEGLRACDKGMTRYHKSMIRSNPLHHLLLMADPGARNISLFEYAVHEALKRDKKKTELILQNYFNGDVIHSTSEVRN